MRSWVPWRPEISAQLFPDSDAQYKDISSLVLLKQVGALIADEGRRVLHIDAVVAAQQAQACAAHSSDAAKR